MKAIVHLMALEMIFSLAGSCRDRAEEFVPAPIIRNPDKPAPNPSDDNDDPGPAPADPGKPPADPEQGDPAGKRPQDPDPTPPSRRPADSIALDELGLRPLGLAPEAYPAMIYAEPLASHKGEDEYLQEWRDECDRLYGHLPLEERPIGGGYNILGGRVFWGYEIPRYIDLGRKTKVVRRGEHISGLLHDREDPYNEPFWPAVGTCHGGGSYDSLRRLHNDYWKTPDYAPHNWERTPYDLRHIRIASRGVDVSPMFAFAYNDYRPAIEGKKMNLWRREAVRASEVGMHELDWIRGGYFWLIPLTDDYQDITVHFVLRDGSVISAQLGKG